MRTMYDSVNPARIPRDAQMVAGYVNGPYKWSDADWALFPNAIHVGIAVRAAYNGGEVLDVEIGDATPGEAPGWVEMRRSLGVDPTVYCNLSTWPSVVREFDSQGVAPPHYWIAQYNGDPRIPAGAIAKQYLNTANWDISSVADYWPGIDTQPVPIHSNGVTLMDRILMAPSAKTTSRRLLLPGGAACKLIVRPPTEGSLAAPVWLGDVFAWASDMHGIGEQYNPKKIPGYNFKVVYSRELFLPNAVWCDFNFSCNEPFVVDIVG